MSQNIKEYIETYGIDGLNNLLEEFIKKCPDFPEAKVLTNKLGENIGDLMYALASETNRLQELRKKYIYPKLIKSFSKEESIKS